MQGLADVFILLKLPFDSPQADLLNVRIFETIYYAALSESCKLAEKFGPYPSYRGSPVSKGVLQFDLWGTTPTELWDWDELRDRIAVCGLRNSLLLAVGGETKASQILGGSSSVEPLVSNIVDIELFGEQFLVVNEHLVNYLLKERLWGHQINTQIITNNGSVQEIDLLSPDYKAIFRTAFEIPKNRLLEMAAHRAAFIDHSHAITYYLTVANPSAVSFCHILCWTYGLKSGMCRIEERPSKIYWKPIDSADEDDADRRGGRIIINLSDLYCSR